MSDCPNCEYHKARAARWRAEAYAQAGHDVIERPWIGLTDKEKEQFVVAYYPSSWDRKTAVKLMDDYEAYLKEKNGL